LHARSQSLHSFPTRRSSDLRLEWAAVQSQGVFASVLAAHGRREWVLVEPQPPNTLVVHLIPIDAVVNMPALQQEGNFLKGMWRPDRKSTRLNSSHQIISYAV